VHGHTDTFEFIECIILIVHGHIHPLCIYSVCVCLESIFSPMSWQNQNQIIPVSDLTYQHQDVQTKKIEFESGVTFNKNRQIEFLDSSSTLTTEVPLVTFSGHMSIRRTSLYFLRFNPFSPHVHRSSETSPPGTFGCIGSHGESTWSQTSGFLRTNWIIGPPFWTPSWILRVG
jgi:hypothetical protein